MRKGNVNDKVAKFLASTLPEETANAYRIIANVQYPVDDMQSLVRQLQNLAKKEQNYSGHEESALLLIRNTLTPLDFPITSIDSGLEKFHARISIRIPEPFIPPGLVPRFQLPTVPARSEFITLFGIGCGQAAYEVYRRLLAAGVPEPGAYWEGLREGRRCNHA